MTDAPRMATGLLALLRAKAAGEVTDAASLAVAISRIPYGRPTELTARGVVTSWRGTCSTKHILLRELLPHLEPAASLRLVHRVYQLTRSSAEVRWGDSVAATVPAAGLVDVHTYALLTRDSGEVVVDVTFPISEWDGTASLTVACGRGEDTPAGDDPLGSKAQLVLRRCDPEVREPFIAALAVRYG